MHRTKRDADDAAETAAEPSPRRARSFGETSLVASLPDVDAPERIAAGNAVLKVLSLNVHGWHNEERGAFDGLVAMLRATQPT